jgi:hypothetical protein
MTGTLAETAEKARLILDQKGPSLSARTAEDIAWDLFDHALNTEAMKQIEQVLTLTLSRSLFSAAELTELVEAVEATQPDPES